MNLLINIMGPNLIVYIKSEKKIKIKLLNTKPNVKNHK